MWHRDDRTSLHTRKRLAMMWLESVARMGGTPSWTSSHDGRQEGRIRIRSRHHLSSLEYLNSQQSRGSREVVMSVESRMS